MPVAQLPDAALFGAMRRYGDMTMHAVLDVRRRFSAAELERALAATVRAFPVLDRRYETRFWRDRWVPVERPLAEAVVSEEPSDLEARTDAWVRRSIDATRERPVRVVALGHPGGTRLVLSITHLVVDGAGVAAVGHVFAAALYGRAPRAAVEPRRDVWRTIDGLRWFHLPVLARELLATATTPLSNLAAARRERAYTPASEPRTSWRHIAIPGGRIDALRGSLPGKPTVNDLLVATFARVASARSRGGPVVVTYTMDLRRYGAEPRLMASNTSSILWARVPRDAVGDLASATAHVSAVTKRQRERLSGPAFMVAPHALAAGAPHAVVRRLADVVGPAIIDQALARGLLMTNVGRLDEGLEAFGDDLEAIRIVGPHVDGLPVPLIVAYGFRGQLHLQLYAPPQLGHEALDELEREIAEALGLGER